MRRHALDKNEELIRKYLELSVILCMIFMVLQR